MTPSYQTGLSACIASLQSAEEGNQKCVMIRATRPVDIAQCASIRARVVCGLTLSHGGPTCDASPRSPHPGLAYVVITFSHPQLLYDLCSAGPSYGDPINVLFKCLTILVGASFELRVESTCFRWSVDLLCGQPRMPFLQERRLTIHGPGLGPASGEVFRSRAQTLFRQGISLRSHPDPPTA